MFKRDFKSLVKKREKIENERLSAFSRTVTKFLGANLPLSRAASRGRQGSQKPERPVETIKRLTSETESMMNTRLEKNFNEIF